MEQAEHALQLEPNDAEVRELLGQIYADVGEIVRAITQLEKALSLKPGDDAIKRQIANLKKGD